MFLLHAKVRTVEILKLSCIPLTFTSFLTKKKQKVVWKWSPNLIFCVIFKEKYFCYFLLIDHISLCGCLYWVWYWSMSLQYWTKYLEQNREIQQNWIGQEKFDIYFCVFFCWYWQSLISGRETWHWAMSPPKFEFLLIFPDFLSLKSFGNSWVNSYIKFTLLDIMLCFSCG